MSNAISMMDLMFLLAEKQEVPCHVGAVLIFRRPRAGGARVASEIVEAYRRLKPRPPFDRIPVLGAGTPRWRKVDTIDPRRHVTHLKLPPPGSDEQLHWLLAELHEPLLDRTRPGWRIYVIEGLAGDRFAIYHKCHHSLVDGEAGMEILRRSLSTSASDRQVRAIVAPPRRPGRSRSSNATKRSFDIDPAQLAHRALAVGRGSLQALAGLLEGTLGYSSKQVRSFTAPVTPMNEPIAVARSVAHLELPLRRMKTVAHAWHATLNDVALAILDDAMQGHLRDIRRRPDRPLVAICPVLLGHSNGAANRLSTFVAPMGEVDASVERRLQQISAHTRTAKEQLARLGDDTAYVYTVATFALTEGLAAALPTSLGPGMLLGNVVLSNVRGPDQALYLNGARLEAIFPLSMLAIAVGLNVTMISYDGKVVFGFTANGAALPDVSVLARRVNDAFVKLESRKPRRGTDRARATRR